METDHKPSPEDTTFLFKKVLHERKSEKTLWGMPLYHIGKNAKGVVAVGVNARGIIAVGKYFAFGDNARAMIAIGDTKAAGSIYEKIGELTPQDVTAVKELLDTTVPSYFAWAKEIVKTFL